MTEIKNETIRSFQNRVKGSQNWYVASHRHLLVVKWTPPGVFWVKNEFERENKMASISKDKNGTKRITYYNADKKQECIRLGKVPMKIAETIKVHVENLVSAQRAKVSVGSETAGWLSEIPDELYGKFVQRGFVPPRRVVGTLGEVIPKIIKEKSIDAKPATIEIYEQSERSLYQYFGEDRQVNRITDTEAKEFGVWLAKNGSLKKSGALKQSTVYKPKLPSLSR